MSPHIIASLITQGNDKLLFEQIVFMVSNLYYEGVSASNLHQMLSDATSKIKSKERHHNKGPCLEGTHLVSQH